jgi:bacteriocin-like protein
MTKELLTKIKEMEEKLGQGWMKELESVKTEEELKRKAAEFKIDITDEVAAEALRFLNDETEELSEEELAVVSGGVFVNAPPHK